MARGRHGSGFWRRDWRRLASAPPRFERQVGIGVAPTRGAKISGALRRATLSALALVPLVAATPAAALCRQALAIGLDISGSVDAKEYRLQLDGLAGALLDPDVQAAFLAMPNAWVRLYIYEWGGFGTQRPIVGWTEITGSADLNAVAATLLATLRAPHDLSTALGKSMLYGAAALIQQSDCWRATLDLSGDGKSNIGPQPIDIGGAAVLAGITINALVIAADAAPFSDISQSEIAELSSYFRSQVIRGPDAFVQTAIEFENFQDAMARKLLKELQTRAVGALVGHGRQPAQPGRPERPVQ